MNPTAMEIQMKEVKSEDVKSEDDKRVVMTPSSVANLDAKM